MDYRAEQSSIASSLRFAGFLRVESRGKPKLNFPLDTVSTHITATNPYYEKLELMEGYTDETICQTGSLTTASAHGTYLVVFNDQICQETATACVAVTPSGAPTQKKRVPGI